MVVLSWLHLIVFTCWDLDRHLHWSGIGVSTIWGKWRAAARYPPPLPNQLMHLSWYLGVNWSLASYCPLDSHSTFLLLQEELVPAVAQHFAAQVCRLAHLFAFCWMIDMMQENLHVMLISFWGILICEVFQVVEENETLLSFAFFLKKQQTFATSSMTQHQVAHPVAK